MSYASIAIMVVGFIGLIICAKKQKVNPAMQPLAIGCLVIVLAGLGLFVYQRFSGDQSDLDNEKTFTFSKSAKAGSVLARNFGGKKVIYIVEPKPTDENAAKNAEELNQKKIEAFKAAYGSGDVQLVYFPAPKDYSESGMALEDVITAKDFSAFLDKHADVGAVVSEVALPRDGSKIKLFAKSDKERPGFFLLNNGNVEMERWFHGLIAKGKITGCIMPHPKADYQKKAEKDLLKTFDIRYRVIDKSNAGELK